MSTSALITVGEVADGLLKLEAGDVVSISGRFTAGFCSRDGAQPRVSFRIIADHIASPRLTKRKEAA